MIKRLRVEGFKAIGRPKLDVVLAPITLLLGENSVGKSSLLQALLAIQQSWQSFAGIGRLRPAGPLVDLGRFSSVQHRMGDYVLENIKIEFALENDTGVGLCWSGPNQQSISDQESNIVDPPLGWPSRWKHRDETALGTLRSIRAGGFVFRVEESDSGIRGLRLTLCAKTIARWLKRSPSPIVEAAVGAGARLHWWIEPGERGIQPPYVESETMPALDVTAEQTSAVNEFQTIVQTSPDLPGALWSEASKALSLLPILRRQLRNTAHIGGIRDRGKRLYEIALTDNPISVGENGDRIADLLSHYPDALERTNLLLEQAQIGYRVELRDLPTQAQVREIILEDLREGLGQGNKVGLPDVGTGISQILPLAVQIAVFGNRGLFDSDPLILMEQPELHLHPLLQARLARMMAAAYTLDAYGGSESWAARPVQFIVETHSEHLVRALSVLVAKKALNCEAISIIKLDRDENGQLLASQMRMDDGGLFLDPWPGGFFAEREALVDGRIP